MATPNVSAQLLQEIKRWADLTMLIGYSQGAPAAEENRFYKSLMLFTHPDRYIWCTVMRHSSVLTNGIATRTLRTKAGVTHCLTYNLASQPDMAALEPIGQCTSDSPPGIWHKCNAIRKQQPLRNNAQSPAAHLYHTARYSQTQSFTTRLHQHFQELLKS